VRDCRLKIERGLQRCYKTGRMESVVAYHEVRFLCTQEMNIYRQKQAENSASTSSVNLSRSQTCTQSGQFSKPQIQQGQRHRVSDSADECTEGADRRKRGRTVYSWFLEQECKYLQAAVGASSETSALVGERWRAMTRTEREFSAALYGSCEGNMAH